MIEPSSSVVVARFSSPRREGSRVVVAVARPHSRDGHTFFSIC